MRVLVCGGRDYNDIKAVRKVLDDLLNKHGNPFTIIEGGASGADSLAAQWARLHKGVVRLETYKAYWSMFGKAAGPIRNQRMIDDGKPDLVVAFPGGRGTADMITRAREASVKILLVN